MGLEPNPLPDGFGRQFQFSRRRHTMTKLRLAALLGATTALMPVAALAQTDTEQTQQQQTQQQTQQQDQQTQQATKQQGQQGQQQFEKIDQQLESAEQALEQEN